MTKSELRSMIREMLKEELKIYSLKEAGGIKTCLSCGSQTAGRYLTNVFGDTYCIDCWDDYLETEKAKVDQYIMIANGELSLFDYGSDFYEEVENVTSAWNKYNHLLHYSNAAKIRIKNKFESTVNDFLENEGLF